MVNPQTESVKTTPLQFAPGATVKGHLLLAIDEACPKCGLFAKAHLAVLPGYKPVVLRGLYAALPPLVCWHCYIERVMAGWKDGAF